MNINHPFRSKLELSLVLCLITILLSITQSANGQGYKIRPVDLKDVRIDDQFWAPRIETNRTVTIPVAFQKYEQRGRMCSPKMIEGASYSLQHPADHPHRTLQKVHQQELDRYLDDLIEKIADLQQDNGYLRNIRNPEHIPWTNMSHSHELYLLGHLYEAAVAHYQATSKRTFLDVATKSADNLCEVFGPDKKRDIPGHPEIELALVKLYDVTGKEKYLKLAKFFLDERGHANDRQLYSHDGIVKYMQDHKPLVEQREAVGHAVRALYLYSGITDVTALTGDSGYLKAIDHIWENCVTKKLYINGGVGVRWEGEAFGDNYELPNKSAHSETCAAIANVFWNYRMNLLHGEAKYVDVLELALYNRVLAGISLDGGSTFYKGPLANDGTFIRDATLRNSIMDNMHCCVSNLARIFPQIGRYIYAFDDDGVYVNLYIGSAGNIKLKNKTINLTQKTSYPWQGVVNITVETSEPSVFDLNLRIPGWSIDSSPVWGDLYRFAKESGQRFVIKINGKVEKNLEIKNGYARLHRLWKSGDMIELYLPMPIRRVHSHMNLKDNKDRVAIMRGPIVYCAEGVDNDGSALNLLLPDDLNFQTEHRKEQLGGITVISGKNSVLKSDKDGESLQKKPMITMIPYHVWAHRGLGEMAIWLKREL